MTREKLPIYDYEGQIGYFEEMPDGSVCLFLDKDDALLSQKVLAAIYLVRRKLYGKEPTVYPDGSYGFIHNYPISAIRNQLGHLLVCISQGEVSTCAHIPQDCHERHRDKEIRRSAQENFNEDPDVDDSQDEPL